MGGFTLAPPRKKPSQTEGRRNRATHQGNGSALPTGTLHALAACEGERSQGCCNPTTTGNKTIESQVWAWAWARTRRESKAGGPQKWELGFLYLTVHKIAGKTPGGQPLLFCGVDTLRASCSANPAIQPTARSRCAREPVGRSSCCGEIVRRLMWT